MTADSRTSELSIAALNMRAIGLLHNAEYLQAVCLLDQAIARCEARVDDMDRYEQNIDSDDDYDMMADENRNMELSFKLRPAPLPLPEAASMQEESETLSLYLRAFVFVPTQEMSNHGDLLMLDQTLLFSSRESCCLAASTLLYNKSMCLQLFALSASGNEHMLHQATETFDLASGILTDYAESSNAVMNFLELAIWNNKACAHYQLVEIWDTGFCMENMDIRLEEFDDEDLPQEFATFASNVRGNPCPEYRTSPVA